MSLRWAHIAHSRPRPLPGVGHSILQQFLHSFHVSDMTTFIIQQSDRVLTLEPRAFPTILPHQRGSHTWESHLGVTQHGLSSNYGI